jgi:hypothetical protein
MYAVDITNEATSSQQKQTRNATINNEKQDVNGRELGQAVNWREFGNSERRPRKIKKKNSHGRICKRIGYPHRHLYVKYCLNISRVMHIFCR